MKKRVIILGATGSIGRSALSVLEGLRDEWEVVGLAARTRCDELAEQANRLRPDAVAVTAAERKCDLTTLLAYKPAVFAGPSALVELVNQTACDCVICAVVGADSLVATLRAVELGHRVALANKEAVVISGALLVPLARKTGAMVIPVDSEHSAIFQALHAGRAVDVKKVHLTASGGPFRTWSIEQMETVTVEDALRHPTWNMGPKITIDSATMMNKALEIVEARWLFDLSPDQIGVLIHPESIIHSLVEFCDGSMIAQLGTPDMRTPIQYALTYPERRPSPSPPLDLASVRHLSFFAPDEERFPALKLGHEVARRGGTCGAVLNGANETAVELFRNGELRYRDIARVVERALAQHDDIQNPTHDDLLAADRWARNKVTRCITC